MGHITCIRITIALDLSPFHSVLVRCSVLPMKYAYNGWTEDLMMANDPSVTELWLGYSGRMKRRHLEQVARALQSATHIVELKFSFSLFRGVFRKIGDLESAKGAAIRAPFVEWIGTSSSLLKLEFQGTSCRREVETHLLSCFIPAISSRAAKGRDPLKSLSLAWVGVNASLSYVRLSNSERFFLHCGTISSASCAELVDKFLDP
jgi:hypothetical protein